MSDRRSGRNTKKVNYATFGGDDDDDFANCTPPPSKKAKTSDNPGKENKVKKKTQEKHLENKRKAPVDRTYERELQAALELSLQDSSQSSTDKNETESVSITDMVMEVERRRDEEVEAIKDSPASPCVSAVPVSQSTVTPCVSAVPEAQPTATTHKDVDDEIEVLTSDSPKQKGKLNRRAASVKQKKVIEDEESDYEDESDSSDEDYDEDDDSDFHGSKKSKKKNVPKAKVTKQSTKNTANKTPAPSKTKAVPLAKPTPSSRNKPTVTVSKKPLGTTCSPSSRLLTSGLPKWTPPGSASKSPLGGVTIKSPSSGGLRLGLSRNQRVKPLHSGVLLNSKT